MLIHVSGPAVLEPNVTLSITIQYAIVQLTTPEMHPFPVHITNVLHSIFHRSIHAIHPLADQTVAVNYLRPATLSALVYQGTAEVHQCVNRNVLIALNAHKIMLALMPNALIRVQELVESVPDAKLSITTRFVVAQPAKLAIHSFHAIKRQSMAPFATPKIHAHPHRAVQIQFVKLNKDDQCVLASLITLEALHIADQNVFSATNVHRTKLAYVKNVKIHASEHAAQTLNAMLSVTRPIVIAYKAIKEMHLSVALRFRSSKYLKIHAIHLLAVKMLNAQYVMVRLSALAYRPTSAIPTRMVADQNVCTIQIVPETPLAFAIIVVIHVREFAVSMLSAQSLTIYPPVRVRQATKVIHSPAAEENPFSVSVLLNLFIFE